MQLRPTGWGEEIDFLRRISNAGNPPVLAVSSDRWGAVQCRILNGWVSGRNIGKIRSPYFLLQERKLVSSARVDVCSLLNPNEVSLVLGPPLRVPTGVGGLASLWLISKAAHLWSARACFPYPVINLAHLSLRNCFRAAFGPTYLDSSSGSIHG